MFAPANTRPRLTEDAEVHTGAAIRREGDLRARRTIEEPREAEKARSVNWWYSDGRSAWRPTCPRRKEHGGKSP